MRGNSVARLAVGGGLIGLFVPLGLFAVFLGLVASKIALGEHFVTALPAFAVALLELPTVCLGRACGLPIEAAGPAFIPFHLNGLGYTLALVFWVSAGLLAGGSLGVSKHFCRRRR